MNLFTVTKPYGFSCDSGFPAEFDRELDRFARSFGFGDSVTGSYAPAIDVVEDDASFTVKVELPGIDKNDVEVNFTDGVLSVKGEKKSEKSEDSGKRWHFHETWVGSFERRLRLPKTADAENVKAEMKDGILSLVIGKKPEAKPLKISING